MAKAKYTKAKFERFLNANSPERDSPKWFIGGKQRFYQNEPKYGRTLRDSEPVKFESFYQDWRRAMIFKDKKK